MTGNRFPVLSTSSPSFNWMGKTPFSMSEMESLEMPNDLYPLSSLPFSKIFQAPGTGCPSFQTNWTFPSLGFRSAQLLIEYPGENNGHTLSIYGEVADFEDCWEKVWASYDDVFKYKELEKFEQPYFDGEYHFRDFAAWLESSMEDITNFYEYYFGNTLFGGMEIQFIIEKDGSITNIYSNYHTTWFFGASREPSTEQWQIIERYIYGFSIIWYQ